MAGTNEQIIDGAFKAYEKYIYDTTEKELREFCDGIVRFAIEMRFRSPLAHNFTGNLLNSIVVGLYRDGNPVIAYYSNGQVKEAIRPKMTWRNRAYVFSPDYDGSFSKYKATVKTNQGWGRDDAKEFFQGYRPEGKNAFDIVVAYTTEYAAIVEKIKGTVGAWHVHKMAKRIGAMFMEVA